VTITSTDGASRTSAAGADGRFEFGGLATGATYRISVGSERFKFAPVTVSVVQTVTGVDIIADDR
jgi:hypothetical protein